LFIKEGFVAMHGHMNVKLFTLFTNIEQDRLFQYGGKQTRAFQYQCCL